MALKDKSSISKSQVKLSLFAALQNALEHLYVIKPLQSISRVLEKGGGATRIR